MRTSRWREASERHSKRRGGWVMVGGDAGVEVRTGRENITRYAVAGQPSETHDLGTSTHSIPATAIAT